MVETKVFSSKIPFCRPVVGLLLVTSYTQGIFAMHGSTQAEFFSKTHSSIRVKAEEHIAMWMGKFIHSQLSLCFGGFPALEQSQRCSSSSSHPKVHQSGACHHQSLLVPSVVKSSSGGTSPWLQGERVCRQGLNGYKDRSL